MTGTLTPTTPRMLTVAGLGVGAIGIAMLWAAGVEFPFYPPPGLVILGAGALFVAWGKWPWTLGVGAFLGLFVIVGFILSSVISGAGIGNLTGDAGALGSLGTILQLIGTIVAFVAGLIGTRQVYRARR